MKTTKLWHFFYVKGGTTPTTNSEQYWNGETAWVTPADFKSDVIDSINSSRKTVTAKAIEDFNLLVAHPGSIVFSSRAPIGKVAIANIPICTNQGCKLIYTANKKKYNNRFLAYWLLSNKEKLERLGAGTTFKEISSSSLSNFEIPILDISEQEKIVSILDKKLELIDSYIKNKEDLLKKSYEYRQSLITRAVTKGLVQNAPVKETTFNWCPQIPSNWKIATIGKVFDVTLGKMLCSTQKDSSFTEENYFCAGSISWDGVKSDYIKRMWFSPKEKADLMLQKGDLLIVEGGAGFGTVTIYKGENSPCYFQNSIIRLRSKNIVTPEFCKYWLTFTYSAYLKRVCNEATFSHYTKDKVSRTPIVIPSLEEQKKIVNYLSSYDSKITAIRETTIKQIDGLKQYRNSLISKVVAESE